jgi:hypothetical protein
MCPFGNLAPCLSLGWKWGENLNPRQHLGITGMVLFG